MPACKLCRARIDLSKTGVRAYRCVRCDGSVCADHIELTGMLCHECANIPVWHNRRSFIRKPENILK